MLTDKILDAAEAVVVRQGIAHLTLDAVAAEAGVSKGGLLHHFPAKDRLVEALVTRCAENWRELFMTAYARTPVGPGRMARALVDACLSDGDVWTEQLRRSSSAVFVALAQNPSLIEPMRAVYSDLHRLVAEDALPPGVGETVVLVLDGLWLNFVLQLIPVDQALMARMRTALDNLPATATPRSSVRAAKVVPLRRARRVRP